MTSSSSKQQAQPASGLRHKLAAALNRGKAWLGIDLGALFRGSWDEAALEELETRLILADAGVEATTWLVNELTRSVPPGAADAAAALAALEELIIQLLTTVEQPLVVNPEHKPFVILMVGVNGGGKTTTIGKLAHQQVEQGRTVILAAGDTFRAGAIDQVSRWAERTGASVVAQAPGADPAAVIFDSLQAARARNVDVVLADTAGRLHTAAGLMDELKKIKRIMARIDPTAPHETLLVLDSTQGQNALVQAREFNEALGVTGLVLTKLDGTAKGGIVLAIAHHLGLPVRFICTGETVTDLHPFQAREFAQALLGRDAP